MQIHRAERSARRSSWPASGAIRTVLGRASLLAALATVGGFGVREAAAQQGLPIPSTGEAKVDFHYEVTGSGPAIVLVHGGMADLAMWDGQVEALAQNHLVIRYDIRGFGRSPAPTGPFSPAADLLALLDELGVERAHVLGGSLGGAIAIDVALSHPERVASLVLPEPAVAGWPYSEDVMRSMAPVMTALQAGDRDAAVAAFLETPAFAYAKAHHPQVFETIRAMTKRNFGGLMAQQQMRFEEPAALGLLGRISVPTLVLVSEAAGLDAERIADRIQAAVPDAKRVSIEDSGHLMNLERPNAFNRAVLDFLRSIEASDIDAPRADGTRP